MIELLGLLGFLALGGIAVLALGVLVLPFVILIKVIGFGLRVALSVIGWTLAAVVLVPLGLLAAPILGLVVVPVVALVGGLLLLKVALLALPFLLLAAVVWGLVSLARRPLPA